MPSVEENLARYQTLLPHLHHTQAALWGLVTEPIMRAGCADMTIGTGCSFFPKDDDSVVAMLNYICFNVTRPDGRMLLDVHVAEHPPEGDDLRAVLEGHQRSRFSMFEVLELVPRLGARLRDLFGDEGVLVAYPRLAEAMRPGLVLPLRVLPLGDFHAHFNGPLPYCTPDSVRAYEENLLRAYARYGIQRHPVDRRAGSHRRNHSDDRRPVRALPRVEPFPGAQAGGAAAEPWPAVPARPAPRSAGRGPQRPVPLRQRQEVQALLPAAELTGGRPALSSRPPPRRPGWCPAPATCPRRWSW
jgi:hypothetical protein